MKPGFVAKIPSVQCIGDSTTAGTGATTQAGPRESWFNGGVGATPTGVPTYAFRWCGTLLTPVGGLTLNPNHEGHSGYVIRQGTAFPSLIDVLISTFLQFDADALMLWGGTNDMDPAVNNDSVATTIASLVSWVTKANSFLTRQSQQLIVPTLLNRTDATQTKILQYNAQFPAALAALSFASRIWIPDLNAAIPFPQVGVNMNDPVHPNDVGYIAIGTYGYNSKPFQSAIAATRGRPVPS